MSSHYILWQEEPQITKWVVLASNLMALRSLEDHKLFSLL